MSEGSDPSRPWFNDRRFNFSSQQIRQHMTQLAGELNQAAVENPELVSQITQQLQFVSDLVRQNVTMPAEQGVQQAMADAVAQVGQPQNAVVVNIIPPVPDIQVDDPQVPGDPVLPANDPVEPIPESPSVNTNGQQAMNDDWRRLVQLLQSREIQQVARVVLCVLPFFLIIALKLLISHVFGLATVGLAIVVFIFSNAFITKATSHRAGANTSQPGVLKAFVALGLWLSALFWMYEEQQIWLPLVFVVPESLAEQLNDLLVVVWLVLAMDFGAKFICMAAKCAVSFVPSWVCGMKTKRRLYQWLEYSNQAHRHWLPVQFWARYLMSGTQTWWFLWVICFALVIVYVAIKLIHFRDKFINFVRSTVSLCRPAGFGKRPSRAQMSKVGNTCSICYTEYSHPILLSCGHIFCQECISTWLDKERTCPMCRSEVIQEDNTWKCGATSWIFQLF